MLKKHLIFITLLLTLTACHYHLRGPMTLAKPLQNMYIQTPEPYGDLIRNLKQYLKMSGVHLAAKPEEATTILNIVKDVTSQDLISINSSQQTRQYSLRLLVTFELLDPHGNIDLTPQTVTETRTLTLQSNQILAGSNQAAQLYHDMRRAIVYSIMTRLSSKEITSALTKTSDQLSHETK